MNYKQWWEQFVSEHDEWRYADSNALRKAAFEAGQESLREQLKEAERQRDELFDLLNCVSTNLKTGMSRRLQKLQAKTVDEELFVIAAGLKEQK